MSRTRVSRCELKVALVVGRAANFFTSLIRQSLFGGKQGLVLHKVQNHSNKNVFNGVRTVHFAEFRLLSSDSFEKGQSRSSTFIYPDFSEEIQVYAATIEW